MQKTGTTAALSQENATRSQIVLTAIVTNTTRTTMPNNYPLEKRFYDKVIILVDVPCHFWVGNHQPRGYGRFSADGARIPAHRWAWEQLHGRRMPTELDADHQCNNPYRVNGEHIQSATHRENVLRGDSPSALHAKKTHCPKGHPLADDNLEINCHGARICLKCKRIQNRHNKWNTTIALPALINRGWFRRSALEAANK